ncbi:HPr family phosphocarrier protein [Microbacterium stercoris]|uniref:Phosphocarrier protein HPr n=1 Tax=Microbacterium stercoris TaxID=2820289 RepID=A0A939TRW5_9MICO|nr:HPr family phosphocarrier protein [Microbacterium stercoris]MBO3664935.1 HPr family phosphocarrier protein [Microbacterium stercoris]
MAQRRVVISGAAGLHARPAAELARLAQAHAGGIRISAGGASVDAASVLAVMGLTLERGEQVVLHADGPDAESVLERAAALL